MTVTWIANTLLAAVLLGMAALAAERAAGWIGVPRRWVWAAAMAGSLALPLAVWMAPDALPRLEIVLPPVATGGDAVASAGAVQRTSLDPVDRVSISPSRVLAGLWIASSLAVLAAFALTHRRLREMCGPLAGRLVAETPVLVAERAGPMVMGLLRPRIVLPRWTLDLADDELALVVRHEREHLATGDHWLLAAAAVAVAAMPWNAALWWQHRRLRLAVETDCDARVLASGPSLRGYGAVLLRTAATETFPFSRALALGGAGGHLERRIIAMTEKRPADFRRRAIGLTALALTLAAGAWGTSSAVAVAKPTPDAAVRDTLSPDSTVTIETSADGRLVASTFEVGSRGGQPHWMGGVFGPMPGTGPVGFRIHLPNHPEWHYRPARPEPAPELPVVASVDPGSSAAAAGLRVGDVILTVNGTDSRRVLLGDPRLRQAGQAIVLGVRQGGGERRVRVVVGPAPSRAEVERRIRLEVACLRQAFGRGGTEQEWLDRQQECQRAYGF